MFVSEVPNQTFKKNAVNLVLIKGTFQISAV